MALSAKAIKNLTSLWLGAPVIVHLTTSVVIADEEMGQIGVAAMIDGILIDVDPDFIYLGQDDGTITRAIKHDEYVQIEEVVFESPLDTIDENIEEAH
jgi:hypothetical protein